MTGEPLSIVDEGPIRPNWGIHFATPLRVELSPDHPLGMHLTQPMVVFDDRTDEQLTVPVGFYSDGASFPPLALAVLMVLLWFAGRVVQGRFRRAAVLHDWECEQQLAVSPSSRVTHERFYRAMRSDAEGYRLAKLMQLACEWRGPKWGDS